MVGEAMPWKREVILWPWQLGQSRAWRNHEAMQERFHPEFPDDVEVCFAVRGTARLETTWVSVIAVDAESERYLGVLLNQPNEVPELLLGDNVVFAPAAKGRPMFAVRTGGRAGYRRMGMPDMAPYDYFMSVATGLNQYRAGAFGHSPENIRSAIATLPDATSLATNETGMVSRSIRHFFLGRCFAELYLTEEAIEEFKLAVELRPEDLDSRLALLAEYSVMNAKTANVSAGEQWRTEFDGLLNRVAPMLERDPNWASALAESLEARNLNEAFRCKVK